MIGLAGEGGGSGHLNFLPGVLAGDGATPTGRGLWKGLTEKECAGVCFPERASPDSEFPDGDGKLARFPAARSPALVVTSVLTTETLLLQQWPIVDLRVLEFLPKVKASDGEQRGSQSIQKSSQARARERERERGEQRERR